MHRRRDIKMEGIEIDPWEKMKMGRLLKQVLATALAKKYIECN